MLSLGIVFIDDIEYRWCSKRRLRKYAKPRDTTYIIYKLMWNANVIVIITKLKKIIEMSSVNDILFMLLTLHLLHNKKKIYNYFLVL